MTAYQAYRSMSWTSDSDVCEANCNEVLCELFYVEGELGHYCSGYCRDEAEGGGECDIDEHAAERRQMGFCDF